MKIVPMKFIFILCIIQYYSTENFGNYYGIGSAAGAAAYYTGGAAFTLAGGTATGGGGFIAGSFAMGTSAISSTAISATGNAIYFHDEINPNEIAFNVALSMVFGGTLQGLNSVSHERNFWNGSFPEVTPMPSISINSVPTNPSQGQLRNSTSNVQIQSNNQPNLNINKQNDGISINFEKSTIGKSIPNTNVAISAKEMTNNLLTAGGQYVPLEINKYAIDLNNIRYVFYTRSSTGSVGVEIFQNGISIQKYSLLK